jgi:hypothetical protein
MKKQAILKASNTENPVVGKFYNVPCAKCKNDWGGVQYIPIIGAKHVGKDFFDEPHYHVDGRFCDTDNPVINMDDEGRTNGIIGTSRSLTVGWVFDSIEIKRRKCKRLTTGIIPPISRRGFDESRFGTWAKKMIGKSCKGKKCPHLGTAMMECEGRLVCPLHNLASDFAQESIEGLAHFKSGYLGVYKFDK